MKPSKLLRDALKRIRSAAGTFEDNRRGPNLRYTLADAVLSAFACFFLQSPSFLAFQRRMEDDVGRSTCQTLFGMQGIPSDGQIRNLLDRLVPDSFQRLFLHLLDTLRSNGDFSPFVRLRDRILVALDGIEFHSSRTIHCKQCSSRRTGKDKRPSFFHTMVAAVVVAPGHSRVVPLMPEFVRTQDDPGDQHSVRRRKQDCEINAAKRWLTKWGARMARYRPVYLGDALYATHPFCQQVLHAGADFLFVVKPKSHQTLFKFLHERYIQSTGWIRVQNKKTRRYEEHCYRWMTDLPIRNTDDAVHGTWVEKTVRVRQKQGTYKQTFYTTLFTSLTVTKHNVQEVALCGRARWKIENECFNLLARHGQNFKHNFGHGKNGLANLLATLNLLAFALHTMLDQVKGLWRQCRASYQVRRAFFQEVRVLTTRYCFPDWRSLWESMLYRRSPPLAPSAARA